MVLIVNYYRAKTKERQDELEMCLGQNLNNIFISKVILLVNDDVIVPFVHDKLVKIKVKERPTFTLMFQFANQYEGIKAIANADIYFDRSIILTNNMCENECYALSRWDLSSDNSIRHHSHCDSQDAWIFSRQVNIDVNYGLGQPGCDNAIAYEFEKFGFKVTNPSLSIKAIHNHISNLRSYNDKDGNLLEGVERVPQPYLRVTPTTLNRQA